MFQEGYMAYLQGWDSHRIAGFLMDIVEQRIDAFPEEAIEDFLDGHAAAAKENRNAI